MPKQQAKRPCDSKERRPGKALVVVVALLFVLVAFHASSNIAFAQKGTAESDYYPMGYSGDIWTGEVVAFDNEQRTLTLTHSSGKNAQTFVASIPDAPYQWRRDGRNSRVIDFAYDKNVQVQRYKHVGPGFAASVLPEGAQAEVRVPNPPASDVITDFAQFKGRKIVVFYTPREREVNGQKVKYNDVWRIRVIPIKK
jgi:hypothetical protein